MQTFSLLTLNIERKKHLHRILPYLETNQPDVICFQELFHDDFLSIKNWLGYEGYFDLRAHYIQEPGDEGIAIFSRFPILKHEILPYDQFTQPIPGMTLLKDRPKGNLLVVTVKLPFIDEPVAIGTVHFTWSAGGLVSPEQEINSQALIKTLQAFPDLILTGDFNTPRGSSIFDGIAQILHDNIPQEVLSTVDPELHRSGKLELVVDGLFTSSRFRVESIRVDSGLSDHCGVFAHIGLAE